MLLLHTKNACLFATQIVIYSAHKHDGRASVIRQRAAAWLKGCKRPRSASDPTQLPLPPERGCGDALQPQTVRPVIASMSCSSM